MYRSYGSLRTTTSTTSHVWWLHYNCSSSTTTTKCQNSGCTINNKCYLNEIKSIIEEKEKRAFIEMSKKVIDIWTEVGDVFSLIVTTDQKGSGVCYLNEPRMREAVLFSFFVVTSLKSVSL